MLTDRLATPADLSAIAALVDRAMAALLPAFLTPAQVAASRAIMGVDSRLVRDGGYFLVEEGGVLAGCGGWSRRRTLYGGDASGGRDDGLLDPATEPARVRAMYTDPAFVRRGVGRRVLALCEAAAGQAGFARLALMATLPGEPLYRACGFAEVERVTDLVDGVAVPLVRMEKRLPPSLQTRPH